MSTMLERRYRRQHLNCVRHITLDPKGRGVVRIHMIPPREDAENAPFLLLLNGQQAGAPEPELGHPALLLHGPAGALRRAGDHRERLERHGRRCGGPDP